MAFNLTLIFHLIGAAVLFFFLGQAAFALIYNKVAVLKPLATKIGLGLAYQLVSGSIMALVSLHEVALFSFCTRIGFYIALVASIELLLFYRLKSQRYAFPFLNVISSFGVGMAFVSVTLFLL